jgi:hypothetical protein
MLCGDEQLFQKNTGRQSRAEIDRGECRQADDCIRLGHQDFHAGRKIGEIVEDGFGRRTEHPIMRLHFSQQTREGGIIAGNAGGSLSRSRT